MITVPKRHRQTDRRTDRRTDDILWHNRALRNVAQKKTQLGLYTGARIYKQESAMTVNLSKIVNIYLLVIFAGVIIYVAKYTITAASALGLTRP